jgi:aminoglycoside 3-N-acetyltransferase I
MRSCFSPPGECSTSRRRHARLAQLLPIRSASPFRMRDYQIRKWGRADARLMRELNELFARAFEDPGPYRACPPRDDYLEMLLAKEHVIVCVAVQDGALIGGLVAYELEKLESRRSEIYIYDLAVDARHRRRGVATALIESLRKIAAARLASVLFVQADYGDDLAIALYEKLGSARKFCTSTSRSRMRRNDRRAKQHAFRRAPMSISCLVSSAKHGFTKE